MPKSNEHLGQIYEDTVSGFVGTVTAVTEYLGRAEKVLELTANTGINGDEKTRWIPETRCKLHTNNKLAGF